MISLDGSENLRYRGGFPLTIRRFGTWALPLMILVLAALFLSLLWTTSSDVQDAKSGVVCVALSDSSGQTVKWGSGFAVGKRGRPVQYVVTNAHVVEEAETAQSAVRVYYSPTGSTSLTARVSLLSRDKDIAVLKLDSPLSELKALPLLTSDGVSDAETVYALGFPGDTLDASDFQSFSRSDMTITSGIVSNRVIQLGEKCFQIDAAISNGNSGGPLVNRKGCAVGIITRKLQQNGSINYAITADELIPLLKENRIPYTCASRGIPAGLLLLGGILAVLVVWEILLIVGRRSSPSPAGDATPQSAAIPARPIADDAPSLFLFGLTGKYTGNRFGIKNGTLVLGRDPSCDIVFPVEAGGVAPRHCEIAFDSRRSVGTVKALDDGYATLIRDGERLIPHQEVLLHSGDILWLTDKTNMFKIRIE